MPSGEESLAAHLGDNLRFFRQSRRLSQRELASRAGVDHSVVGAVERGERAPRVETLVRLAGALAVPVAKLLAGIDWMPDHGESGAFLFTSRVERHRETMRRAAAFRATQTETVDVVKLVREGRDEMARRGRPEHEDDAPPS
jgi:transcriptional regulator with XRE-family HTH domain